MFAYLLPIYVLLLLLLSADGLIADPLDPARVQAIAEMLPDQPVGLGRPISDRAAWARLVRPEIAEKYVDSPLPDQPDDLFLDFSRTGNRTRWQNVAGQRRGRLAPLVFAECVENQGRFLPAIEALIQALCAEKTWVMPAHDSRLTNFRGEAVDIDLASSALGWNLATTDWLLGDKLTPATRQLLRERRKLSDSGAKARLYHEVKEAHLAKIIKVDLKGDLFSYAVDEAALAIHK